MEQFITRADECGVSPYDSIAWAFEVHMRTQDTGLYNSAILYGNEDAPYKIEFFTQAVPLVTDAIAFTWIPEARP